MGYDLTIGKAMFVREPGYCRWEVDSETLANAPEFPGDDFTRNSSHRGIGYGSMRDFCEEVGLLDFFYDDQKRSLRGGHPGYFRITKDDLILVKAARDAYVSKLDPNILPGFVEGDPRYDYNLCRLDWLIWWMDYSITKYKKKAAISNS